MSIPVNTDEYNGRTCDRVVLVTRCLDYDLRSRTNEREVEMCPSVILRDELGVYGGDVELLGSVRA